MIFLQVMDFSFVGYGQICAEFPMLKTALKLLNTLLIPKKTLQQS